MTKQEFFMELEKELATKKDDGAMQELLKDLSTHFDEAVANGQSESEVCTMLGNPAEIAEEYLSFDEEEKANKVDLGKTAIAKQGEDSVVSISLRSINLDIEEYPGNSFEVVYREWGQETEAPNIEITSTQNSLHVAQTFEQDLITRLFHALNRRELFVRVPKGFSGDYNINLTSGNTKLIGCSTTGKLTARTRSGNMEIHGVVAEDGIAVSNLSGNIRLYHCTGDTQIENRSGNVKIENHKGNVSAEGTSGNIKVQTDCLTKESNIKIKSGIIRFKAEKIVAPLHMSSTSGTIKFEAGKVEGPLYLNCTSGGIKFEVDQVLANITAQTKSGIVTGILGADTKAVFQNQSMGFKNDFVSSELPKTDLPVISLGSKSGMVRVKRMQ